MPTGTECLSDGKGNTPVEVEEVVEVDVDVHISPTSIFTIEGVGTSTDKDDDVERKIDEGVKYVDRLLPPLPLPLLLLLLFILLLLLLLLLILLILVILLVLERE